MAPKTRSQASREYAAQDNVPPTQASSTGRQPGPGSDVHVRQDTSVQFLTNDTSWRPNRESTPDEPPRFTIDLSRAPEERYDAVCAALKPEMRALSSLFDEVMVGITTYIPKPVLTWLCALLLRGVRDTGETRELRGIGRATGIPLYLLVCFNVLLDLFMGCSSGGATVRDPDRRAASKMVHFRTLDWGMPALRRVLVQLDFITTPGGPIVASTITYAGFVGVLTGVRKDFSVSLNFRPQRKEKGNFAADVRYYWHLAMVLLGWRRSISSELRKILLPQPGETGRTAASSQSPKFWSYSDVVPRKAADGRVQICGAEMKSTACYLCFSNGDETIVLEKDLVTAVVHRSDDFIVVTNSDDAQSNATSSAPPAKDESPYAAALAEIVHEAKDRKECTEHNYRNQRAVKAREMSVQPRDASALKRVLDIDDIVTMVQKYPTTNESTHFACVLDPKPGRVHWCRRWMSPITARWIRAHPSDTW